MADAASFDARIEILDRLGAGNDLSVLVGRPFAMMATPRIGDPPTTVCGVITKSYGITTSSPQMIGRLQLKTTVPRFNGRGVHSLTCDLDRGGVWSVNYRPGDDRETTYATVYPLWEAPEPAITEATARYALFHKATPTEANNLSALIGRQTEFVSPSNHHRFGARVVGAELTDQLLTLWAEADGVFGWRIERFTYARGAKWQMHLVGEGAPEAVSGAVQLL